AGAVAGMTVDLSLYPLDTLKTRLQARDGFRRSGGFRGIYRGVPSVLLGSAPNAAIFFCVYDQAKQWFGQASTAQQAAWHHMWAASLAEVAACVVRVPVEVVKQRAQTQAGGATATGHRSSAFSVAVQLWRRNGMRAFYRGFGTTIMREASQPRCAHPLVQIPFTCIQFPLYEHLKQRWAHRRQQSTIAPWQAALCGVVAGGCAAALTTPLDVLKTRKMLSDEQHGSLALLRRMIREEGLQVLMKGAVPRVLWIGLGGAVFLGVYEKVVK
ncbi:mitochondrial carrier domain-containing protein, partial [Syncephalis pseudoplumigaleata]